MGYPETDSRGRAVYSALSKVFNPIGFKVARALLVTESRPLSVYGENRVYEFIAELCGYKFNRLDKGLELAVRKHIPNDIALYEKLWLERLYNNLEDKANWSTPIELDATASMLGIIGILLSNKDYLEKCNITSLDNDIWGVLGINREAVKKSLTPLLYGSSQPVENLLAKNGIEVKPEEIREIEKSVYSGFFKAANDFKEFTINNCNLKETMQVVIGDETFEVKCNRYDLVGSKVKNYMFFDAEQNKMKRVRFYEYLKKPNLQLFRRFFQTCLIHNLDSRLIDYTADKLDGDCLTIHDAAILHPNYADRANRAYGNKLKELYENRNYILRTFFSSIGIKSHLIEKFLSDNMGDSIDLYVSDEVLR
jgi:hypothetical protein